MARQRTIDPQIIAWLRDSVERTSVRTVARALDMSDATVMRILAGLDVQAGTAALIGAAYSKREPADEAA